MNKLAAHRHRRRAPLLLCWQVLLNVYDVAGGGKEAANSKVVLLNNVTRDLQLGGIFHGGLQIGTAEFRCDGSARSERMCCHSAARC